jgi:hypothetical protein
MPLTGAMERATAPPLRAVAPPHTLARETGPSHRKGPDMGAGREGIGEGIELHEPASRMRMEAWEEWRRKGLGFRV